MPMKPRKGESQSDFMARCVPDFMKNNPKAAQDQAVAACISMFKNKDGDGAVMHKMVTKSSDGMEFVLSDASPDRYGDVVEADGWVLDNFNRNPIALFNHNANFPLGRWKNLRVENNALKGELVMAPEGTSDRIDEIRRLMQAGILRAVSVGFRPLESKPRGKTGGEVFTKQELVETSLVSVPANPNALAVAKSLHVSDETMDMVFAEQGRQDNGVVTRANGGKADSRSTSSKHKDKTMTLSERIAAKQAEVTKLKDQLVDVTKSYNEANPDEANETAVEELSTQIAAAEKSLATLKRAEATLASTTRSVEEGQEDAANGGGEGGDHNRGENQTIVRADGKQQRQTYGKRPFAVPAKKLAPADYMWRSLTVLVKHHFEKNKRPIDNVLMDTYGEDVATKAVMDMVTRAATGPATTTGAGWAAELVTTAIGDFMEALRPVSVFAGLSPRGAKFTFGRNGIISLPTRSNTPTVAGSFVLQGSPIPVRQAAFQAITLTPKKMAVISTFTREIAEHSTPAIEGLIRQAILEDTAVSVDTVLLDAGAATATRPAGLLNTVSAITGTAITGGAFAAVVGDLRALAGALITATNGNVRQPVWIMNPADVLALSLTPNTAGDLPFRDELARGTLLGYPVIQSTTVPVDTMILLDAADFVSVTGDDPRFDVSDQATLHMEDTTPLALGTTGSPNVVAAPVRSLWQTDTLGIRMIMDMNWAMRRVSMVALLTGMTWNA